MENGWGAEPCALIFSYFNFLIIFFFSVGLLMGLAVRLRNWGVSATEKGRGVMGGYGWISR